MSWMDRAACKGMDTDLWFQAWGRDTEKALRVCARCPVTRECLDYQMRYEGRRYVFRFGIFGGLLPQHRRKLADLRR